MKVFLTVWIVIISFTSMIVGVATEDKDKPKGTLTLGYAILGFELIVAFVCLGVM